LLSENASFENVMIFVPPSMYICSILSSLLCYNFKIYSFSFITFWVSSFWCLVLDMLSLFFKHSDVYNISYALFLMSGRPCNVSEILADLVETIRPLAQNQKRVIELSQLSLTLLAAVEEPALRQAFSNLIEGALLRTRVGGKVAIVSTDAPAGGTLVLIDDDGPDMHYMVTSVHSRYLFCLCTFLFNKLEIVSCM
jgi:hypothetical protein